MGSFQGGLSKGAFPRERIRDVADLKGPHRGWRTEGAIPREPIREGRVNGAFPREPRQGGHSEGGLSEGERGLAWGPSEADGAFLSESELNRS